MSEIISVAGLVKKFGSTRALDELDLRVNAGEVHGFLGPNGSGKSTAIRVLLGMLRPDSGSVSLLGGDPWTDAVHLHQRLAYVPGDVSLWPNLTGGEVIDLLGRLRGGINSSRRSELLEMFELDPTKKGRTYSKGNRQKVALVAALASDAELLIMDEPTSGLDPLMESMFQACIQKVRDQGRTVLLSSHILAEIESLCDRVTIIREGRTVETGSLTNLRHLALRTIEAQTESEPVGLSSIAGVHDVNISGTTVNVSFEPASLGAVSKALADAGITSLQSAPPTLEQLFMRHYEGNTTTQSVGGDGS